MFGKDDEAPIKAGLHRSCKVCRKFFKDASEPTADCSACKSVNQDFFNFIYLKKR